MTMFTKLTARVLMGSLILLRYVSGQVQVTGEAPIGTANGVNAAFNLSDWPRGAVRVFKNGLRQQLGGDYSLLGNTILFSSASIPQTGDVLLTDYVGQPAQCSRSITIDHTKVLNSDQTDFAVLVSGIYPSLATTANGGHLQNGNGYDIIFTSDAAGQNVLSYERFG
jgi:hypothetical protein